MSIVEIFQTVGLLMFLVGGLLAKVVSQFS